MVSDKESRQARQTYALWLAIGILLFLLLKVIFRSRRRKRISSTYEPVQYGLIFQLNFIANDFTQYHIAWPLKRVLEKFHFIRLLLEI